MSLPRKKADLLFGFGHEKYLREFIQFLPGHQQTLLMSATLTEQVEMIKKLTMKKHVTLKLEEASLPDENVLQQFHICLNENFEKFLVALSFLKARAQKTIRSRNHFDPEIMDQVTVLKGK